MDKNLFSDEQFDIAYKKKQTPNYTSRGRYVGRLGFPTLIHGRSPE